MKDVLVPALFSLPASWPEAVPFVFGQADLVVSTVILQSKVQKNYLSGNAREQP